MTITRTVQVSIPTIDATPSTLVIPKMLDSALLYRSWGLSVIPICTPIIGGAGCYQHGINCTTPGKIQLIAGIEFYYRLPTENEIKSWWSKWPNANIAIITGSISKNLVVIDTDDSAATRVVNSFIGSKYVPIVKSQRGGRHFYFINSSLETKIAIRGFHIDIRGQGTTTSKSKIVAPYIIAPPSIGSTGTRYEWLIYPKNGEFPALPTSLYKFLAG